MANAKGIISSDYGILLKGPWTASQATSVLKTLREIHKVGLHWRPPATLELVGKLLPADIVPKSFVDGKPTSDALISDDVFRHSEPREAVLDQVKGKLTSSRLRQALITFLTRFGYDSELAQFILQHHFGTVYGVGHGNKPNFTTLTDPTTREGPGRFDDFLPMEMVWILHWFWEMPNYMHRIDALDWLVRRAYGQEHPYYPYSPAVSWPDSERHSYTEYGDITFSRDCETMRHLILHEKCHFLYARQLSDSQIEGWKELSGWATRPGGDWQPAVSTPFVSGYAARVNPDEDMAETMAEYILHPALLFSRSPAKFQYFERAIMEGHRYMPRAWPSAQFLVVNQAPYANYPAKVTNVRISVTGALNDDKYVEVVLRLAPVPGFSTPLHAELDVAPESGGDSSARLTFHSLPHDPTTLVANTTIDRRLPYGFWTASQLKLNDDVGLCRYIPLDRSSWRLYVNNRRISNGENIVYVPDTLHVTVTEHVPGDEPNQDFTQVSVKWRYTSSSPPYPRWPANARIYRVGAKSSYFKSKWGHCKDLMRGDGVGECEVLFSLNDYDEGEWRVSLVYMQDATGASYMEYFDRWVWDERATSFKVAGKGTDVLAPQVDADSVAVECIAKDSQGASDVHISFTARDDLSGIGYISYRLLDPQGVSHLGELVHEDSKTHRFKGNPAAWKKFDFHLPLPKGSFPGVWAIEEIEVWDKVGNRVDLRMVETLHFVPDDPGAYGDGDDGFDGTTYSPEPTEAPTPAPTPSPTPSPTPQSPTLGPHAKAKTDKTKAGQPQTKKSKSESK